MRRMNPPESTTPDSSNTAKTGAIPRTEARPTGLFTPAMRVVRKDQTMPLTLMKATAAKLRGTE